VIHVDHTITQINPLEIQILKYFFKENKNGMANSMTWASRIGPDFIGDGRCR